MMDVVCICVCVFFLQWIWLRQVLLRDKSSSECASYLKLDTVVFGYLNLQDSLCTESFVRKKILQSTNNKILLWMLHFCFHGKAFPGMQQVLEQDWSHSSAKSFPSMTGIHSSRALWDFMLLDRDNVTHRSIMFLWYLTLETLSPAALWNGFTSHTGECIPSVQPLQFWALLLYNITVIQGPLGDPKFGHGEPPVSNEPIGTCTGLRLPVTTSLVVSSASILVSMYFQLLPGHYNPLTWPLNNLCHQFREGKKWTCS